MKTLRVAALQLISKNDSIEDNLAHAEPFVSEARQHGAVLVLLPELYPTGFIMTDAIWKCAESSRGPTVRWLKEQSLKHGIWIGTSFLEAVEDCFCNTFVLTNPQGDVVARVRKSKPAATEAFFFEGRPGPHVIDTPLGRIGVSICYEGFLVETLQHLHHEGADLVLMPHSAPTPTCNAGLEPKDIEEYNSSLRSNASAVARELGVPTVMANKAGPWKTASPWFFPDQDSRFPGYSRICAADGSVQAELGEEEGVIVADITLDPTAKAEHPPKQNGKWARAVPEMFKLFAIGEIAGKIAYSLSLKRRRAARKISAAQDLR